MRLTKPQKDKIKSYILKRFDLVDVITGYGFELREDTENRMKMNCPFHNEKTASFMVYADDGRFHCFGCQESGNVINFMMHQKEKNYHEIIEEFSENVDVKSNKFFTEAIIENVNKSVFNVKAYGRDTDYELSVFLRDLLKKKLDKAELVDSCFRDMDMFFSNPDNMDEDRIQEFSDMIIDKAS